MENVVFEFSVSADHPCLPGHFPGRAIVPGVLLLDHLFAGLRARCTLQIRRIVQVKFQAALLPQEAARAEVRLEGLRASFQISTMRGDDVVCIARGSCTLAQ